MQTIENSEKRVVETQQTKLNSHYKQLKTSECWKPWEEGSKSNAANYSLWVKNYIFWKSSSQNAHPLIKGNFASFCRRLEHYVTNRVGAVESYREHLVTKVFLLWCMVSTIYPWYLQWCPFTVNLSFLLDWLLQVGIFVGF